MHLIYGNIKCIKMMYPKGLFYYKNIIPANKYYQLCDKLLKLNKYTNINKNIQLAELERSSDGFKIMGCQNHYKIVMYDRDSCSLKDMHYLENSVDQGHDFIYFFGKMNVPNFIKDLNIDEVCKKSQITTDRNYNCGINLYKSLNGIQTGLKWHTDLKIHGNPIIIYSLLNSCIIEFRDNKNNIFSIDFDPMSCIVLSDDARWNYQHRILEKQTSKDKNNKITRMSISFGFQLN